MPNDTRIALITGAAQGLGRATARRLAHDGFHVVVADVNVDGARAAAREIDESGRTATPQFMDVTSDDSVAAVVGQMDRLDVLVNNAGVISRRSAWAMDSVTWDREFAVNLDGVMRCSRDAFRLLAESANRNGAGTPSVVNLASVGSSLGLPQRISYATAKTAIVGLTRTLAAEWGRHGIRVNAVAPGYIETPMMLSGLDAGVLDRERLINRTPLMRFGQDVEIAAAISFLVSPDASFVTGAVLPVDGGITIDGTFQNDQTNRDGIEVER